MAIQLQLQSETQWFLAWSLLLHKVVSLLRSLWCHYGTILCCVKAGTPMFGQFYNLTRVSGLFPGRGFVTPKVKWLLWNFIARLKGFLCLVRTWGGGELRPFSLYPREALLALGRIWFLEFSFAQIPYCAIHCQWDKRGGFEENGDHDSHMNNASSDGQDQSKGKHYKKEKVNSVLWGKT